MKKVLSVLVILVLMTVCLAGCGNSTESKYNAAVKMINDGRYDEAVAAFEKLGGYQDSNNYIMYAKCLKAGYSGQYDAAISSLKTLGDFQESKRYTEYFTALKYESTEDYEKAQKIYAGMLLFKDTQQLYDAIPEKINAREYAAAKAVYDSGHYGQAYEMFIKLKGFKDVDKLLASMDDFADTEFAVGSTVTFGTYPQTALGNDNTPIEWLVLDRDGGKVLLISKYALDQIVYEMSTYGTTWEDSWLRGWLNDDFYECAFNADERVLIKTTRVTADKNPQYDTDPGNDTTDNVFLLSIPEIYRYFPSDESRICSATDYAVEKGAYMSSDYKDAYGRAACSWWLRSPGTSDRCAAFVRTNGTVGNASFAIHQDIKWDGSGGGWAFIDDGVRPCVWIWLSK